MEICQFSTILLSFKGAKKSDLRVFDDKVIWGGIKLGRCSCFAHIRENVQLAIGRGYLETEIHRLAQTNRFWKFLHFVLHIFAFVHEHFVCEVAITL